MPLSGAGLGIPRIRLYINWKLVQVRSLRVEALVPSEILEKHHLSVQFYVADSLAHSSCPSNHDFEALGRIRRMISASFHDRSSQSLHSATFCNCNTSLLQSVSQLRHHGGEDDSPCIQSTATPGVASEYMVPYTRNRFDSLARAQHILQTLLWGKKRQACFSFPQGSCQSAPPLPMRRSEVIMEFYQFKLGMAPNQPSRNIFGCNDQICLFLRSVVSSRLPATIVLQTPYLVGSSTDFSPTEVKICESELQPSLCLMNAVFLVTSLALDDFMSSKAQCFSDATIF